jgi:hypothetical protein
MCSSQHGLSVDCTTLLYPAGWCPSITTKGHKSGTSEVTSVYMSLSVHVLVLGSRVIHGHSRGVTCLQACTRSLHHKDMVQH